MLSNFHTHSTYCDGKNTLEEIVLSAIEKGFSSLGFSGHGFTSFDSTYCMKETDKYIAEIKALREKYKKDIQLYIGVEEDAFYPLDHSPFDYVIGSSHYFNIDGTYYPVDSNPDCFKKCLELFKGDVLNLANSYYSAFCDYILKHKPDIVGHFDLITKFDEMDASQFLENEKYNALAESFIKTAAKSGSLFEVNTGAISRGYRTSPYPAKNLLYTLKNEGAGLVLCSDSHAADTLDCFFKESRLMLKDIGFEYVYTLYNGEFVKDML